MQALKLKINKIRARASSPPPSPYGAFPSLLQAFFILHVLGFLNKLCKSVESNLRTIQGAGGTRGSTEGAAEQV
jgi:hypothetical protein